MLPDLPNECMSSAVPNGPTVRYSVGSIHCEHVWYIAKMEGIISVIVTAVDTASLFAL